MTSSKKLIVIQGPTACGKTALAIALAQHFQTEIISGDSRQFYRELEIGTAKPNTAELSAAKHHFIDSDSIHQLVNAAEYEQRALALTEELFQKYDTLILVGGSGLFIDALVDGLDPVPTDDVIRQQLLDRQQTEGIESLVQELVSKDETAQTTVDLNNPVRVIRALEVFLITGKPFSSFKTQKPKQRSFESIRFAIDLPREVLYNRINKRVDLMLEAGLWEEAQQFYVHKELKSLQTVGYQEFFDHLDGNIRLDEAIELVKRNSRRYAKRQLTWLRRTKDINWLVNTELEKQMNEILTHLK